MKLAKDFRQFIKGVSNIFNNCLKVILHKDLQKKMRRCFDYSPLIFIVQTTS